MKNKKLKKLLITICIVIIIIIIYITIKNVKAISIFGWEVCDCKESHDEFIPKVISDSENNVVVKKEDFLIYDAFIPQVMRNSECWVCKKEFLSFPSVEFLCDRCSKMTGRCKECGDLR